MTERNQIGHTLSAHDLMHALASRGSKILQTMKTDWARNNQNNGCKAIFRVGADSKS